MKKNADDKHSDRTAHSKQADEHKGEAQQEKSKEHAAHKEDGPQTKQHDDFDYETISGELCPFCNEKTLTLTETSRDIPFFGVCHLFSMDCDSCKYHKADVEAENADGTPVKYQLEIDSEEDMKIRIIKSSEATVKLMHVGSIEPGETANGYITNVEGVLNRIKNQIEHLKDAADADEDDIKQKAKNQLKKMTRIMWGQEKATFIIEDPTGNSAIISPKAVKSSYKPAKKKK
jgi:zinc finger protein